MSLDDEDIKFIEGIVSMMQEKMFESEAEEVKNNHKFVIATLITLAVPLLVRMYHEGDDVGQEMLQETLDLMDAYIPDLPREDIKPKIGW